MSTLFQQKQNEVFQSIAMCKISNSVDVVHKIVLKFFGFARAQIWYRMWPG